MHQIDPMKWERAAAVLLNFRHPLLKLEKKSFGQPSEPKKNAYHGQNFRKVHFKAVRAVSRLSLAWLAPLYYPGWWWLEYDFITNSVQLNRSLRLAWQKLFVSFGNCENNDGHGHVMLQI